MEYALLIADIDHPGGHYWQGAVALGHIRPPEQFSVAGTQDMEAIGFIFAGIEMSCTHIHSPITYDQWTNDPPPFLQGGMPEGRPSACIERLNHLISSPI